MGSHYASCIKGLPGRYPDNRLLFDPGSPKCGQWPKKRGRSVLGQSDPPDHFVLPRTIGRSRGGLTTKIHALVDAIGRPILLKLTKGQAHDGRLAADCIAQSGRARPCSPTAPLTAMACVPVWQNEGLSRISGLCPREGGSRTSTQISASSATKSRGSLANSHTSGRQQPDTTNATTISSRQPNWCRSGYGCEHMSQ